MRRRETATSYQPLLWRLPLVAASLAITAWAAPSIAWWAALALPVVAGMLVLHLFEPDVLDAWYEKGYLLLADTVIVALALYGAAPHRPLLAAGLFAVVLTATLTGERRKSLLAAGALCGILFGAQAAWEIPGLPQGSAWLLYGLFLLAAGLSFGVLAEQVTALSGRGARSTREAEEQWALLEITETIGSTLDLGQVMRAIVKQVGDMMEVDSCSILLNEDRIGGCFVVASKGHPELDMLEVDLQDYPEIRRALDTREPVVIKDVATSPVVASVRDTLVEKGYRSLLVVPLLYGSEVLGALFLRANRERPFSPEQIRFCKLGAGASANALKNALLYRDVAAESKRHRATGEKLRRVLDCTPDMILATDTHGRLTEFNRGAQELTGWSCERALGRSLQDVFGVDLAGAGEPSPDDRRLRDVAFRRYDGQTVDVSVAGAPLMGADEEFAGHVWIGRDVTQLRRVERNLAQAERLSSLGEVVAGVAHELNNPLSGVVGYAELLRMHATAPEQIRDLDRIVESALRCQKIVFKLLSFARKHPPEKKSHDLNECVSRVLDLKSYHLRSSQIRTRTEFDSDLPRTCFDFHQIEQVVLNLLNNAEQAIASMKSPGNIVLRTGVVDDAVFVRVDDDGPGVPAPIRERIFDPFFTTKEVGQGTGLGLAVSYGIVKEHGGRIELRASPFESGASFTVYLPIVAAEQQDGERASTEEVPADGTLAGRRILVVEDEPLVLELFARVLSEDGALVTMASDGQQALEHLAIDEFDLIVADLRMPNVDGRQLYEAVAEQRPDLLRRFVFATGDLVRQESVAFLQRLPNRILTKPLEVETVRRVLSQAIAQRPN